MWVQKAISCIHRSMHRKMFPPTRRHFFVPLLICAVVGERRLEGEDGPPKTPTWKFLSRAFPNNAIRRKSYVTVPTEGLTIISSKRDSSSSSANWDVTPGIFHTNALENMSVFVPPLQGNHRKARMHQCWITQPFSKNIAIHQWKFLLISTTPWWRLFWNLKFLFFFAEFGSPYANLLALHLLSKSEKNSATNVPSSPNPLVASCRLDAHSKCFVLLWRHPDDWRAELFRVNPRRLSPVPAGFHILEGITFLRRQD